MKRLRFSYLVLGVCAALLVYGLIDASGRTAALFIDAREATGFVDASVSFPTTPTIGPATEEPVESATAQLTTTPERTSSPQRTGTPERTASPERTGTPDQTPSPARTVASERTEAAEQTPEPQETEPPRTSEPQQTPASAETVASEQTPTLQTATVVATLTPEASVEAASPSPQPTRAQSPTAASTREPTAIATTAAEATSAPGACDGAPVAIAFTKVNNYSGPGPFDVDLVVSNTGETSVADLVLGFSTTSGAQYLDEAVFGNGQLWWPHGEPDAAVLYAISVLGSGESTTVALSGTLTPAWTTGADVSLRVAIVGPSCVLDASESTLAISYAAAPSTPSGTSAAGGATAVVATPSVTATPIGGGATPIRTVLGIDEAPTAGAASATAAALGQTLPEAGDGSGGTGTTTWLLIAGLSIALACFVAGAIAGGRWFPRR